MDNKLQHHGVKGMHWGVRRTPEQLGRSSPKKQEQRNTSKVAGKASKSTSKTSNKSSETKSQKPVSKMSEEELRQRINRLELENKYRTLTSIKGTSQAKKRAQDFILDVLEKSGKNIATQLTTYGMGTAVNKIAGQEIVNPKKGQKDK